MVHITIVHVQTKYWVPKLGQSNLDTADRIHSKQLNQFIAAHQGKPVWLTQGIACAVCKIIHDHIGRWGMFPDEYRNSHPREWMKQV